jgi:hypothetical protein
MAATGIGNVIEQANTAESVGTILFESGGTVSAYVISISFSIDYSALLRSMLASSRKPATACSITGLSLSRGKII